jgi:methyl acetate hydrolase
LGQFAVRSSGKNLRQLLKEIIFQPLRIPPSEVDIWISPTLSENRAGLHIRGPDKSFKGISLTARYTSEESPPEGKAYNASGGILASCQAYAKVLQAVLNHDTRILSEDVWQMATKDDSKSRGVKMPKPLWKRAVPRMSYE